MEFTQKRLYQGLKGILGCPFSQMLQLRAIGEGHVPASGPALLISNHASILDPLVLGVVIERPIRFMAASFVFDLPLIGPLYRQLGAFGVDVDGQGDAGLEKARQLLHEGELVGMFPEGLEHFLYPSCQKALAPFQPGFAKILLGVRHPVPVVPAAIAGFGNRFHLKIPPPLLSPLGRPFRDLGTRLWGYQHAAAVIREPSVAVVPYHCPDPEAALALQYRAEVAKAYLQAFKLGPMGA